MKTSDPLIDPAATRARTVDTLGRQRELVKLIGAGKWRDVVDHQRFADQWGVSYHRVSEMVAEAARHVALMQGDLSEWVARRLQRLDDLSDLAAQDGQINAAIKAEELAFRARGALVQRVQVEAPQLSREDTIVELRKALAELEGVEDEQDKDGKP